jgi:predicted metalloprotease
MRWDDLRRSDNVEDAGSSGGGGGFRIGGGGLGIAGLVGVLFVGWLFGVDPIVLLNLLEGGGSGYVQTEPQQQRPRSEAENRLRDFSAAILGSTEDVWGDVFQRRGATYERPHLALYSGAVQSACGFAQAAMGPFYCAGDRRVYLDLSFFAELRQRFHAPGEFAQAYVIAHEVGHHVQNLTGTMRRAHAAMQQASSRAEANSISVRLELQADCYAGLWAHHADQAKPLLEQGDIEAALNAASAIGDDKLQQQAQGRVVPDAFTHGSSAQRVRWFKTGLEQGTLQACDTFRSAQR